MRFTGTVRTAESFNFPICNIRYGRCQKMFKIALCSNRNNIDKLLLLPEVIIMSMHFLSQKSMPSDPLF